MSAMRYLRALRQKRLGTKRHMDRSGAVTFAFEASQCLYPIVLADIRGENRETLGRRLHELGERHQQ